jgi:predicted Fe-Mo cluster-binding NifX family protein
MARHEVSLSDQQDKGGNMKVAVTSVDGTMEGKVDERFGRTRTFVIYDVDTGKVETAGNEQQMNLAQGAGIQTAQNVVNLGAKAVVSGHLGPKAFQVLLAAGIEAYAATNMTVADAVARYREGSLQKLNGADVEGHW